MKKINGHNIADNLIDQVWILVKAAWLDGFNLTIGGGTRTYEEQLANRKKNVIDKSKVNDIEYLTNADNGEFSPRTAKPGTSNHELDKKGKAYAVDYNTKKKDKDGRETGEILPEYEWLVKNAHRFGWVRTVPSERWHWEWRPGWPMFSETIPKGHYSWDGHDKDM